MKKLVSFWKQVREKSSDMFTLFRVGIGVKVPTHKFHVKDKSDPIKIEGLQNDTTDPDKFLTIDASNIVKYRTGAQVLTDVGGTPLTTEEVQDIIGAMFTSNAETRISVTYQDGDGTIDLVVDDMTADTNTNIANTDLSADDNRIFDLNNNDLTINNAGDVTIDSPLSLKNGTSAPSLKIFEDSDNGTNYIDFTLGALAANRTITFPDATGTVSLSDTQLSQEQVEDFVAGLVTAGTNMTITYDDAANTLTFAATDTNTTYTGASGIRLSGTSFSLDSLYDAVFASVEAPTFQSRGDLSLVMDQDGSSSGDKIIFKERTTEVGSIDDRGNLQIDGSLTGKVKQIHNQSFLDDLSTTTHYLPFSTQNEQTTIYQEEAAMIMPCDGKVVSVTVRTSSVTGSGDLTIGVHTIGPNTSHFSSGSWTTEETEVLPVTSTDDYHVFHFAFSNTKHFESTELLSLSIKASSDLSGTTYWYVTTVVEYDWNTYLGTTSAEYDSVP